MTPLSLSRRPHWLYRRLKCIVGMHVHHGTAVDKLPREKGLWGSRTGAYPGNWGYTNHTSIRKTCRFPLTVQSPRSIMIYWFYIIMTVKLYVLYHPLKCQPAIHNHTCPKLVNEFDFTLVKPTKTVKWDKGNEWAILALVIDITKPRSWCVGEMITQHSACLYRCYLEGILERFSRQKTIITRMVDETVKIDSFDSYLLWLVNISS